jgi:DNA invertase Pin-like site-specific DNA recombinase
MSSGDVTAPPAPVRCAIYTRKSTEEGLTQEFNSLEAQRECCEAYIESQRQQGWRVLAQPYDDGGFTGANLNRPALQQLLADIEAGGIDAVVIYKVDRLSRSLFDFARLMQIFDQHRVSFVSVTQQLNSSTPMGRLTLHVLLSFAQFERELISERTRDKISAARRKGKWMGGYPVLGYDADATGTRLVVNEAEAERVREIFGLFLRHGELMSAVEEIRQRGWGMKSWTTRKGRFHAGEEFDRPALARLLTNVLYVGKVKHHGKVYAGEQAAIVEAALWQQANDLLRQPRGVGEQNLRNRQGGLLQGLLECGVCGSRMVVGNTQRKGRRYAYYVCLQTQKRGAQACPGQSVAAQRIEAAVVEGVRRAAEQCEGLGEGMGEGWEKLGRAAQHDILRQMMDRVCYNGRKAEAIVHWCGEPGRALTSLRIQGKASVEPAQAAAEPKGPVECAGERLPRITRLLALAVRLEGVLGEGTIGSGAELARLGGVSRARITQILNLRHLAPAIQEEILVMTPGSQVAKVTERAVRRLTGVLDWRQQTMLFEQLVRNPAPIFSRAERVSGSLGTE